MSLDRRSFVTAAASLAASAALGRPTPATAEAPPMRIDSDPLGVRADFPICATRTFLNSAYIAPMPKQVLDQGRAFLEQKATEPLDVGALLRQVGQTRAKFARLINATPEEVALLFATSEGENIVANAISWQRGDNVVVDDLHYEAAFVIYRQLEATRGVELRIVPSREGAVTAADYERHVDARTKLVSLAWVSSVNGFRHDVKAIAEVAHAKGALVYADAIQAVGMIPVDVQDAGVDALCCGTYKWLLAGFGVAPFYVRRSVLDRIRPDRVGAFSVANELPDHRFELRQGSAGKFTYATLPFAEVVQLGAALDYLEKVGIARIEAHTVGLAGRLQEGLQAQGFRFLTPAGSRSAIVTFAVEGDSLALVEVLAKARVDVTVREHELRVSMALFNSPEDVDRLLDIMRKR